jgi:hypothetical protein
MWTEGLASTDTEGMKPRALPPATEPERSECILLEPMKLPIGLTCTTCHRALLLYAIEDIVRGIDSCAAVRCRDVELPRGTLFA